MCAMHNFLVHCFGCSRGSWPGDICLIPVTNQSGAVEAGIFKETDRGRLVLLTSVHVVSKNPDGNAYTLTNRHSQQVDTDCSVCHRDLLQTEEHESNRRINYLFFCVLHRRNGIISIITHGVFIIFSRRVETSSDFRFLPIAPLLAETSFPNLSKEPNSRLMSRLRSTRALRRCTPGMARANLWKTDSNTRTHMHIYTQTRMYTYMYIYI